MCFCYIKQCICAKLCKFYLKHCNCNLLSLILTEAHFTVTTLLCVSSVDIETRTALHWAALNGHLAIVESLLAHGATSSKDKIYGFTPLMLAARQGHARMVELLIGHNNDVDATDIHGETALFDAVRNNNIDCVKLLIKVLFATCSTSLLIEVFC